VLLFVNHTFQAGLAQDMNLATVGGQDHGGQQEECGERGPGDGSRSRMASVIIGHIRLVPW